MQTKWNYTISESQNAYSPTVVAAMPKNKLCSVKNIVKETSDNWYTTDCAWHSEAQAMCTEYSKTSAELFEDPENGNFKIKDALFKNRAGDPQWFSE